jgi:hypothetical protein
MSEKIDKRFQVFIKDGFDVWCYLSINQYRNNDTTSIRLLEVETNEPFATLTTCIPEFIPDNEDEIVVKLYSENSCLVDLPYDSHFFERTDKVVMTGHNMVNIWKIIDNNLMNEIRAVKKKNTQLSAL